MVELNADRPRLTWYPRRGVAMNRCIATLGVLLSLFSTVSAQEQGLRERLFAEADQAMAVANGQLTNVLAPLSYEKAARHYRDAENGLVRGRNLEGVRSDLADAVRYFNQSTGAANVTRATLRDALAAREDAEGAEAARYAENPWRDAEKAFVFAASHLEHGNMNRARRSAENAEEKYRGAELLAIENNYLSGARARIAEAKDQRVERYAPKTLARAESLLTEAETSLRLDRYDTDYPRSLAREAHYEARHALHLANRIRAVSDRDLSNEDLLLEAEAPVVRIAGELDLVAELDEGFDEPTATLVDAVERLRADRETLAFLEDEMANLKARLGDESEQRKYQEQIQQRFEQIASVFSPNEAQVFRRGDDVIVRMGLNFDSGSSVIQPQHFVLLRKIQTAIDVFPGSQVEVQGHTDSFGADEFNMSLSLKRARAVEQYLLANMNLGSSTIEAVGHGETVPLANNETPEGRSRNRRIDLLIEPNLDELVAGLR